MWCNLWGFSEVSSGSFLVGDPAAPHGPAPSHYQQHQIYEVMPRLGSDSAKNNILITGVAFALLSNAITHSVVLGTRQLERKLLHPWEGFTNR